MAASAPDNRSPAVLVVDDSALVCRALERELRALGREARSACTPHEAVDWLRSAELRFDIVLVDMFLDHDSGLDLLGFLAEECPEVRRVVMSGVADDGQLDRACASGQASFALRKPWDRDRLARALDGSP